MSEPMHPNIFDNRHSSEDLRRAAQYQQVASGQHVLSRWAIEIGCLEEAATAQKYAADFYRKARRLMGVET